MSKVVTFGEIMLRLTTPEYHTIENANNLHVNYGGVEANVAISLARFGHETYFVSRLPENQLGDGAIRYLNGYNVNTKYITRGKESIGIYFLESGFGGRSSKVLYNRKNAAITKITKEDVKVAEIFKNADWFHFSGITLALSESVRETVFEMLKYAKKNNVKVSFDCNYRQTLWTLEEARPHFISILPYVDILFASEYDLENLFNVMKEKDEDEATYFRKLIRNSNVKMVLGTNRKVYSQNDNELSAYLITEKEHIKSRKIRFNIYDRIGGGDAFASGIIDGMLENSKDLQEVLEFGLAASVLKHTLWGDAFTLSKKEVKDFMENSLGNIKR